jgi:Tfp pilus assembly protein PilF
LLTIDQQVLTIEQALKLARQHHNSGQLPQAESIYKKVLHTDPGQPTALHLLGVVAHQVGKDDIAVDHITKALAVEPDNADAHNNLGATLQEQEKLDDAIARFREAITNDPNYADAHYNLGAMLQDVGKLDESTACYRKVLDIDPGYAQAHNNLGVALQDQEVWMRHWRVMAQPSLLIPTTHTRATTKV